jgi:hypothetical protein
MRLEVADAHHRVPPCPRTLFFHTRIMSVRSGRRNRRTGLCSVLAYIRGHVGRFPSMFCPRCGSLTEVREDRLYCLASGMDFSPVVRQELTTVAESPRTEVDAVSIRWGGPNGSVGGCRGGLPDDPDRGSGGVTLVAPTAELPHERHGDGWRRSDAHLHGEVDVPVRRHHSGRVPAVEGSDFDDLLQPGGRWDKARASRRARSG